MSQLKVGKRDFVWGIGAQLFQFGSSVAILPYVLHKLPAHEMAVWYLYVALMGIAALLDFGFSSTSTLNIGYVFSGAKKLAREGVVEQATSDAIDYGLLGCLIATIRKIYRIIAVCAFLSLALLGSPYLYHVVNGGISIEQLWFSWGLVVISTTLNLYYGYYGPLLTGSGRITEYRQITVFARIIYILVALLLLYFDFGLIGVAGANLSVAIVTRALSFKAFHAPHIRVGLAKAQARSENLFPVLWYNSKKNGVVALGSFLIQKSNIFVVAPFLSLKDTASLGLAAQLIGFVGGLATTFFYTIAPTLNGYRVRGDREGLREHFAIGWIALVLFFVFISFPLIAFGNPLLEFMGSDTKLPSQLLLSWMLLTSLLEANHGISAGLITTRNIVPYTVPALASGISIVALTYAVLCFTDLKLWGVVAAQFLVQAAYNNWKWPVEMLRDLETSYPRLAKQGIKFLWHHHVMGGKCQK